MRRLLSCILTVATMAGNTLAVAVYQTPQSTNAESVTDWYALPADEKHPARFGPFLKLHPKDEIRRAAAVNWYARRANRDVEKLKHHTFLLAKYHPANPDILFANFSTFYADPAYRNKVSKILEKHVANGAAAAATFWLLGKMYVGAAVPPKFEDEAARQRFLRYYSLSQDAPLPRTLDVPKAETAATYYRKVMLATDEFWHAMAAESLVGLLVRMERATEAAHVCEAELKTIHDVVEPRFLVACGRALHEAGQLEEAKRLLLSVREIDDKGYGGGPACATTAAFTQLGLIAVERGHRKEASKMLLASAQVQKCPHNTTKGMPYKLANRLFDAKEFAAVAEYCKTVLTRITPEEPEIRALLGRCRKAMSTTGAP